MSRPGARPPAAAQIQPTASELGALMQLHREENFARLESRTRKLLKRYRDSPMLLMLQAAAQNGLGKRAIAIDVLKKLVAAHPGFADAYFNLGQMLIEADRMEEAADALGTAVRLQPDPDGFNNLGAVLREVDRIGEAIEAFQQACTLRPDFHQAHFNHGLAQAAIGENDAAADAFTNAINLSPLHAPTHYHMSICELNSGDGQAAEDRLIKVLELDPDFDEARIALGMIYRDAGRSDEAYALFEKVSGEMGAVRQLETLLTIGDEQRFKAVLADAVTHWPQHRWIAATASFGCHQWGITNPHPYAPDPLSYVSIRSLRDEVEHMDDFISNLAEAADEMTSVWENRTTRGGYQTFGNLFAGSDMPDALKLLEQHIRKQIKTYCAERAESDDLFINDFPKNFGLFGWRVKLMSAGHQIAHIHTKGWMSGVFYLKIPDEIKEQEGSIVFSLHGFNYPIRNADIPEISHLPTPGDLVLFPSSLFHRTVPFASNEERQCIAFDVIPLA